MYTFALISYGIADVGNLFTITSVLELLVWSLFYISIK